MPNFFKNLPLNTKFAQSPSPSNDYGNNYLGYLICFRHSKDILSPCGNRNSMMQCISNMLTNPKTGLFTIPQCLWAVCFRRKHTAQYPSACEWYVFDGSIPHNTPVLVSGMFSTEAYRTTPQCLWAVCFRWKHTAQYPSACERYVFDGSIPHNRLN